MPGFNFPSTSMPHCHRKRWYRSSTPVRWRNDADNAVLRPWGRCPHHRADLVAVDIEIADPRQPPHLLRRALDPRMQAERQAEARGIERRADIGQPVASKAHHMQHGAE